MFIFYEQVNKMNNIIKISPSNSREDIVIFKYIKLIQKVSHSLNILTFVQF